MEPNARIIAFAHSLFMQRGIRAVSMDEIAAGLGMSKKTLYQFFADKDQLVEAVVAEVRQPPQLQPQQLIYQPSQPRF